jgi:CheY-like chemotaxis protein
MKAVLVVEDDLYMRAFIRVLLETAGYAAIITQNGREGLQRARESSPDLIILDLMMPEEGGIPMYRELKMNDRLKDIPVVVLSGVENNTFSHSLRMLNLGQEDPIPGPEAYIEKPPSPEELLETIERILGPGV